MNTAHEILVGRLEGEKSVARPGYRREKMNTKRNRAGLCELDLFC
jgi:hypothetical protein